MNATSKMNFTKAIAAEDSILAAVKAEVEKDDVNYPQMLLNINR